MECRRALRRLRRVFVFENFQSRRSSHRVGRRLHPLEIQTKSHPHEGLGSRQRLPVRLACRTVSHRRRFHLRDWLQHWLRKHFVGSTVCVERLMDHAWGLAWPGFDSVRSWRGWMQRDFGRVVALAAMAEAIGCGSAIVPADVGLTHPERRSHESTKPSTGRRPSVSSSSVDVIEALVSPLETRSEKGLTLWRRAVLV